MENSIFKNYINKYFSSTSIVNSVKISFKFISILIYIWFFCLIIMFYRFIIVNIFIIIHLTPFCKIKTRLLCKPCIMGLEILAPVFKV